MKKGIILEGVMTVWAYSLMAMVVVGIGYAVFSVLTGNVSGTASFEF
jgi:hypothetical protein